jgi:hypothetical protein
VRAARREEYGHPAKRQGSCLQCYSKTEGILCKKCSLSSAEEHRALAGAIGKLRGSKCEHCAAESIGVVVFAGNGVSQFCEFHARDYRSLDFIPALGFVKYGSIPALVVGAAPRVFAATKAVAVQ